MRVPKAQGEIMAQRRTFLGITWRKIACWTCIRHGHDWFPLGFADWVCMRCGAER